MRVELNETKRMKREVAECAGFAEWPFEDEKNATTWALFNRFKWFRWLSGGLWQQFDQGRPGRPYLQWMQMKFPLPQAIATEDYRPAART